MSNSKRDLLHFPDDISNLADKFRNNRLDDERVRKQKKIEREKQERQTRDKRLKDGLVYAKKIYRWAELFRTSAVGQELMKVSHIPTAYQNIFFFDGHIEGVDWVGLVLSPKGLSLDSGGRWSTLTRKEIKSALDLAASVDTRILELACEWIDDGQVWECIKRHFGYLNKKTD